MSHSSKRLPPLWRCPECGRGFANRNQSHSCSDVSLQSHFKGKGEHVRELFDALEVMIKRCGPVKVLPARRDFLATESFARVSARQYGGTRRRICGVDLRSVCSGQAEASAQEI